MLFSTSAATLLALLVQYAAAVDNTVNPTLNANLKVATSQLDRLKLLSDNDFLFDFTTKQPFYNFLPGGVTNMNAATFPAAIGNGMTCEYNPDMLAWDTRTNADLSGNAQSRPLFTATTASAPSSGKFCRRSSRQYHHVYVRGEWCPADQTSPHSG